MEYILTSNPTIENARDGVAAYKASGADYMITMGGGSFMDTGKVIGIIIKNPEFGDVRSLEGVAPAKNPAVFTNDMIRLISKCFCGAVANEEAGCEEMALGQHITGNAFFHQNVLA